MKNTYTIPADRREDIEKLVARVQKKAAKYGKELSVSYGPSYAKGIPGWLRGRCGPERAGGDPKGYQITRLKGV